MVLVCYSISNFKFIVSASDFQSRYSSFNPIIHHAAKKCKPVNEGCLASLSFFLSLNSGTDGSASCKPCACSACVAMIADGNRAPFRRWTGHFRNMRFPFAHVQPPAQVEIAVVEISVP